MDNVLQLAGALGVDLQGVVQEKDLGKLDEGDEDNPVDEVFDVDEDWVPHGGCVEEEEVEVSVQ